MECRRAADCSETNDQMGASGTTAVTTCAPISAHRLASARSITAQGSNFVAEASKKYSRNIKLFDAISGYYSSSNRELT